MQCPLCGRRKARRQCPALGRPICAICCGTKRMTEISCPSDCAYLASSRNHPPAVVQKQQDRDMKTFLPTLQGLTRPQSQLALLLGSRIAQYVPPGLLDLGGGSGGGVTDQDIVDAASTLAATLETADRGIIYEHTAESQPARLLAEDLRVLLTEVDRESESRQAGAVDVSQATGRLSSRLTRDAAVALRHLEQGARDAARQAQTESAGNTPTAYRDLLKRLLSGLASPGSLGNQSPSTSASLASASLAGPSEEAPGGD